MNNYERLVEMYGKEWVFRQLAEEAAELTQAALKMVRALREETPITQTDAQLRVMEEIADVQVMIQTVETGAMTLDAIARIRETADRKEKRMFERMMRA